MSALVNSLLVASAATGIAFVAGWAVALSAAASGRTRRVWIGAGAAALAMPPFVVANCWLELSQPWRLAWTPERAATAGLPMTALVLGLLLWPVVAAMALSAWGAVPTALLEAEPRLRGARLVRDLLWPAARPAMTQAAAVVFALAIANFAVPVLFQVRVLPEQVWVRFNTRLDSAGALTASLPMIGAVLPCWLLLARRATAWPRLDGAPGSALMAARLGPVLRSAVLLAALLALAASLALPCCQLVLDRRTWTELPGALAAGAGAIAHSASSSALATVLVCAAGLALSGAFGTRPLGPGPAWLAFLMPGTVLAIGWIALLNRPAFASFYPSRAVVVLALAVRYLGPAWAGIAAAVRGADPGLIDAARLGGGRWRAFHTGLWPQVRGQVYATGYLTYLLCLWDVESVILIAPPGGETLAMRAFNLLHYGHAPQVNALCVTLLGLALAPLPLVRLAGRVFRT